MYCKVKKSIFSGNIYISSSKSETMRAIAFAALGLGISTIENILLSPDTYAMIEGVKAFGVKVFQNNSKLTIVGAPNTLHTPKKMLDVGNSGLALRFLLAFASLVEGEVLITGDESIRTKRIVSPLLEVYKQCGMKIKSFKETNHQYLSISGKLQPGVMRIDGKDSQLISSLLFSTQFLSTPSKICVFDAGEKPWVDLTIFFLQLVGAKITQTGYEKYLVFGNLSYEGFHYKIGGDYSSALFPVAASLITNGIVSIYGLDKNSLQADLLSLKIFRKMGATIEFTKNEVMEVFLKHPLVGIEVNINDCIDILPILCVVASFAKSKTIIKGYEIAKNKESNRVESMIKELKKMGGKIEEHRKCIIVYPKQLYANKVDGCSDHRVALSLLVAGLAIEGTTYVGGIEYSVKSYPTAIFDFFVLWGKFRFMCKNSIVFIGFQGVGKTFFGKKNFKKNQ